jgi:hypothetical protein
VVAVVTADRVGLARAVMLTPRIAEARRSFPSPQMQCWSMGYRAPVLLALRAKPARSAPDALGIGATLGLSCPCRRAQVP